MGSGTVQVLVVDSAAFIRGYQVQNYCQKAATVKDVVDEIKDAQTRRNLQVLPYELEIMTPRPESLLHVSNFSKKTGDYSVLSLADLTVLALTYELECSLGTHKGSNLRSDPVHKVEYSDSLVHFKAGMPGVVGNSRQWRSQSSALSLTSRSTSQGQPKGQESGCHIPGGTTSQDLQATSKDRLTASEQNETTSNCPETTVTTDCVVSDHDRTASCDGHMSSPPPAQTVPAPDQTSEQAHERFPHLCLENTKDLVGSDLDGVAGREGERECRGEEKSSACALGQDDEDNGFEEMNVENESEEEYMEDGSTDDEGWITPENVAEAKKEMRSFVEEKLENVVVGCMTTDFAMQNVLLQLGIPVVSPEGLVVKEIRTYLLQCKGCFKTTSNMTKVFCPTCGQKTLIRVIVCIDSSGNRTLKPMSQKQFSTRGMRYSQPKMKGGRHANNPIIAEDQRVTYCQPRQREGSIDVFSPEYTVRSSPFSTHDVVSRGATLSFSRGSSRTPKNPNAVRKKGKKKK